MRFRRRPHPPDLPLPEVTVERATAMCQAVTAAATQYFEPDTEGAARTIAEELDPVQGAALMFGMYCSLIEQYAEDTGVSPLEVVQRLGVGFAELETFAGMEAQFDNITFGEVDPA